MEERELDLKFGHCVMGFTYAKRTVGGTEKEE